ncbi:MAG TPA: hypothetical protein VGP68_23410 [Gemmataceae bacterium]|jgi:hypothetical protein|nr:hypothetical protein [Gemmataceae bacterium]
MRAGKPRLLELFGNFDQACIDVAQRSPPRREDEQDGNQRRYGHHGNRQCDQEGSLLKCNWHKGFSLIAFDGCDCAGHDALHQGGLLRNGQAITDEPHQLQGGGAAAALCLDQRLDVTLGVAYQRSRIPCPELASALAGPSIA